MSRREDKTASKRLKLPMLAVSASVMLALPTASLAIVGLNLGGSEQEAAALDLFTPASVDPELAARVADKAREKGLRFTPAGANPALRDGTVTVAIRIDDQAAEAISVREANDAVPGLGPSVVSLKSTRFDLGISRGYQSFARTVVMPESIRDLSMPDLSEFEPAQPTAEDKPSFIKPRIELEDTRGFRPFGQHPRISWPADRGSGRIVPHFFQG
jgi:hypothetical protein